MFSGFRNLISNLLLGDDEEEFIYFWEDIDDVEQIAVSGFRETISINQILLVHLGLALVSIVLLISALIEERYLIILTGLILVGLIIYSFYSMRQYYQKPLQRLDKAIYKLNDRDFSIEQDFVFYESSIPILASFEKFRNEMVNIFKESKKDTTQLSRNISSLSSELLALKLLIDRTNEQLAETLGSNVYFQKIKDYLSRVSQGIDAFISIFDEALVGIANISSEMKSIAKQITMLSLNAGIEAARAGEKGIGFEIVASNLRRLAYHVTESTQGIKGMVKTINDKAKDEIELVTDTMNGLTIHLDKSHQSIRVTLEEFEQSRGNLNKIQRNFDSIDKIVADQDTILQKFKL
ncbi:MAG: methyl-accepting chemotaxis protein [Candidatus Kariarchaeaceae archaeon]